MATQQQTQPNLQPQPQQTATAQPQQSLNVASAADPSANLPAKTKRNEVDKSLVTSTIRKLPPVMQPLSACFDDAWGSFVKAYGHGAGQVMAREIDFAVQAMMANTYLIDCAMKYPIEFVSAIKNVALANSTLSPVLKLGYLVPFKGKVTFMPSYMGLVDVLVNNGLVRKVEAHPVFEGEFFKIKHGTGGCLRHIPNPWGRRDKDTLLGVYYFAVLADGTEMYDTLSFEEVETLRKRAPSSKSDKETPWDTDYIEMAKKSAVRRAFKMIPKRGISDDKIKVLEAVFDYDEKVQQNWISEQKALPKRDTFDEEEVEYEEVKQPS